MEKHALNAFIDEMNRQIGKRIKERIESMGTTQVEIARRTGLGTSRLGNYVQGVRPVDPDSLVKIATALNVTTDWLLGLSEVGPLDIRPIVRHLLLLEGLSEARADVIAETVQEAQRILSAFPDDGDESLRSRMAAQAAWQTRRDAKPA